MITASSISPVLRLFAVDRRRTGSADGFFLEPRRVEFACLASLTPFTKPDHLTFVKAGNVDYSAFHDDSSLPIIFSSFSISVP